MTPKEVEKLALLKNAIFTRDSLNLTNRQRSIFTCMLIQGKTYKEIEAEMGITKKVIQTELKVIAEKLKYISSPEEVKVDP